MAGDPGAVGAERQHRLHPAGIRGPRTTPTSTDNRKEDDHAEGRMPAADGCGWGEWAACHWGSPPGHRVVPAAGLCRLPRTGQCGAGSGTGRRPPGAGSSGTDGGASPRRGVPHRRGSHTASLSRWAGLPQRGRDHPRGNSTERGNRPWICCSITGICSPERTESR